MLLTSPGNQILRRGLFEDAHLGHFLGVFDIGGLGAGNIFNLGTWPLGRCMWAMPMTTAAARFW